MRIISVKLPDSLDRALGELARRRRASRSAVLREALEAFATSVPRSVTAAAGDLVGSVDGPPTLSSSKQHLKGYGR